MTAVQFTNGVFTIDGQFQLDIGTSHVYHETAVALPAAYVRLRSLRHVLILGGGDGCSADVALKFQPVEQVTVVDWDPQVVAFARSNETLRSLNRDVFSRPKIRVVTEDAAEFIKGQKSAWDLIVMDFTASDGESTVDTPEFMENVQRALRPHGAWSRNLDVPWATVARWPFSRRTYHVTVGPAGFQPFLVQVPPVHPCSHSLAQSLSFMTREIIESLRELPLMTPRLARVMAILEG